MVEHLQGKFKFSRQMEKSSRISGRGLNTISPSWKRIRDSKKQKMTDGPDFMAKIPQQLNIHFQQFQNSRDPSNFLK
jgi:hypothetical protein